MDTETRDLAASSRLLPTRDRRQRSRARIPALTILYHPDLSRIGEHARLLEVASGRGALLSRSVPDFASPGSNQPRPLGDPYLSRSPLRLEAAAAAGALRLQAGESRTRVAVEGVVVSAERDFTAAEVRRGVVLELADRVVLLLHEAPAVASPAPSYPDLIGENEGIVRLRNEIHRLADPDVPVLVRVET